MEIETLHENDWLSLRKIVDPDNHVSGYVYSHETRCQGVIVAVLPYRQVAGGPDDPGVYQYLLRSEVTPCWGMEPTLSTVTGGGEKGEHPGATAARELLEETGFDVPLTRDRWTPLGQSRASKSADTIYELSAVDVTGLVPGEIVGDGTYHDTNAPSVWVNNPWESVDPQASVMHARLMVVLP